MTSVIHALPGIFSPVLRNMNNRHRRGNCRKNYNLRKNHLSKKNAGAAAPANSLVNSYQSNPYPPSILWSGSNVDTVTFFPIDNAEFHHDLIRTWCNTYIALFTLNLYFWFNFCQHFTLTVGATTNNDAQIATAIKNFFFMLVSSFKF